MSIQTARAARFDRTRAESVRMAEGARLRVAADFSAVIGDDLIDRVSWSIDSPSVAAMTDPAIDDDRRGAVVTVTAVRCGSSRLWCKADTADGSVFLQEFVLEVAQGGINGATVTVSA